MINSGQEKGLSVPHLLPTVIKSFSLLFLSSPLLCLSSYSEFVPHIWPSGSVLWTSLFLFIFPPLVLSLSLSFFFPPDRRGIRTATWCGMHAGKSSEKMCFHDKSVFVCICTICVFVRLSVWFFISVIYSIAFPVSVCRLCVCLCMPYVFISHCLSVSVRTYGCCVSSHLFCVGSGPDSQSFVFLTVFWDLEELIHGLKLCLWWPVLCPHCPSARGNQDKKEVLAYLEVMLPTAFHTWVLVSCWKMRIM